MSATPVNKKGSYQPDSTIELPPLDDWPPRPLATLKWVFTGLLFPWGYFFILMALFSWYFLTPSLDTMSQLSVDWIAMIWVRNAVLLTLVAGTLHWWFYVRRGQGINYKFDDKWPATNSKKHLWGNQVRDNMFWSLVSGVTFWTLYESITLWMYASGRLQVPEIAEHPVYFCAMLLSVFFWSTLHFYLNHRLLHWPALYKVSHELHHRNPNPCPWTGIAMHPVEHAIYFSVFVLWWVVPVHPVVVILTGFYQGIGPSISHSGFDRLRFGKGFEVSTGDWFHQLHHEYFNFNYGNTPTPVDKLLGSWHDGSEGSLKAQMARMRRHPGRYQ